MKLPKNYVPGSGVHKATAYGGVGQKLLESMGWQKGEGLGRSKSGMTEALDVKEKKDTLGIGASGSWDWSQKFWEDAFNSAVQGIQADSSSSSSSDSSSDSSDDEKTTAKRKQKRAHAKAAASKEQPKKKPKKRAAKASSDSSSSSHSDSDSDYSEQMKGKSAHGQLHRDGTIAGSASAAELVIAAELAKDPWGRWGGKAGKMARIRQQEEEEAARARIRLGLDPVTKPADKTDKKQKQTATVSISQPNSTDGATEKKKRIVVTLTIPGDAFKRGMFVPTPRTGWWGANYFISAGEMDGMEKEVQAVNERKSFNEDDQANLYMKVLEGQRVGHKGLGKSTTINIAGGKWEGMKKTFEDDDDDATRQGETAAPQAEHDTGNDSQTQQQTDEGSIKQKKKKQKKKDKDSAQPEQGIEVDKKHANGQTAAEDEEQSSKSGKKRKRKQQDEEQPIQHEEDKSEPSKGRLKWPAVVKALLQKAPQRRLALEKCCHLLLEHVQKNEQADGSSSPAKPWNVKRVRKSLLKKVKSWNDIDIQCIGSEADSEDSQHVVLLADGAEVDMNGKGDTEKKQKKKKKQQ